MVFGSSFAYVAGLEGQLSIIRTGGGLLSSLQLSDQGRWSQVFPQSLSHWLQRSNFRIGCKFCGPLHSFYANCVAQISGGPNSTLAIAAAALSPGSYSIKIVAGEYCDAVAASRTLLLYNMISCT